MEKTRLPELGALPARSVDIRFPSSLRQFWLWPHLLSLDAVFVALIWQQLFAQAASVILSPLERIALALAVWAIYIADRVLDSSARLALPTSRHIFYQRHRIAASLLAGALLCTELAVCVHLTDAVLLRGLLLSGIVAFHFLTVHTRGGKLYRAPKEITVAAVFAAGTVLAPLAAIDHAGDLIAAAILFAALCLLNCASVEYREWQRFHYSQPEAPPRSALWLAEQLKPIAACVVLIAILFLSHAATRELYGSLAVSSLALIWFDKTHHRMSADQMRVAADVPLLIPGLFLLTRIHGL